MFLAHGPASYIANEFIQKEKISKLKLHEQVIIGACSIIFGIFPDIDLFALMMTDIPPFKHHTIFSHTPFFYLGLSALLFLLVRLVSKSFDSKMSKIFNKSFLDILLKTFLFSTLIHLLMDLITSDIMLFYPFTTNLFTLLKNILEPTYWGGYLFSTAFAIEIFIIAWFINLFIKKYLKANKVVQNVSKIFIYLSAIYVAFAFATSRFTYNNSYLHGANGAVNFDIDYDSLNDISDSDVGNNGMNNLQDADKTAISQAARNIIESNKMALGRKESLLDYVKYSYGALNSYGLVIQSYFDCHKPIPPVLKDFYNSTNTKTYFRDYESVEALNSCLDENKDLLELNLEANALLASGRIFFIKNLDDEILNLGITLENNELAIVLEEDNKLQLHTYTEVLSKYGKEIKIEIQK